MIVGRVTSEGRPVAGTAITVAGRGARTVSASDGRYAISLARSSESEFCRSLERELLQRCRIDI